jgi:N-acetylmuramoyl-L-alanine amidase
MPTAKPKVPAFNLSDDKTFFTDVAFSQAGSFGTTKIKPLYLIMHFTAGRGFKETVARFKDPASKVSAHFVVGRAGEISQMVTLDRPAWHAGADSTWYEPLSGNDVGPPSMYNHMNFHSIGIEFDNYGPLTKVGSRWKTWFGRDVPASEVAEVDPAKHGSFKVRWWHAFSEAQLAVAERLSVVLVREFGLRRILGHSDVCPGRKLDPGPVFPMNHLRAMVVGRDDDEQKVTAEKLSTSIPNGPGATSPAVSET